MEVYESSGIGGKKGHFGKILLLDENLQLTEGDATNYNEMLAHVPLMEHYLFKNKDSFQQRGLKVLVIGGGDGYVVSEVWSHIFLLMLYFYFLHHYLS